MPKIINNKNPKNSPRNEIINEYLLTQKEHKKWYNRRLMGNLGDNRGFLTEEKAKKKSTKIKK